MVQKIANHRFSFSIYLLLLLFFFSSSLVLAQKDINTKPSSEKHFDGLYFGMTMGMQNIFGGAFIDNLDVLGQKSGFVLEFSSGYRKQFLKNRLMVGAELRFGITDGDLNQIDARNQMKVIYLIHSQTDYGFHR